jgi:hypothetical protein
VENQRATNIFFSKEIDYRGISAAGIGIVLPRLELYSVYIGFLVQVSLLLWMTRSKTGFWGGTKMRSALFCGVLAVAVLGSAMASFPPASVNQLLGHYYTIQRSLASDSMNGIAMSAGEIAKLSRQAAGTESLGKTEMIALSEAAAKFNAADLKSARNGFGDLSDKMIAYLKASKAPRNPPYQYYCSMAKKSWLQPDKGTRNPYYGSSMPTCGELVP